MKKAGTAIAILMLLKTTLKVSGNAGIEMAVGRLDNVNKPLSAGRQS